MGLFSKRRNSKRKKQATTRRVRRPWETALAIEPLEERVVLSTFVWTDAAADDTNFETEANWALVGPADPVDDKAPPVNDDIIFDQFIVPDPPGPDMNDNWVVVGANYDNKTLEVKGRANPWLQLGSHLFEVDSIAVGVAGDPNGTELRVTSGGGGKLLNTGDTQIGDLIDTIAKLRIAGQEALYEAFGTITVGGNSGGTGTLRVDSGATLLTGGGDINLGGGGFGHLEIHNGNLDVADGSAPSQLVVGNGGPGTADFSDNAFLETGKTYIGNVGIGSATVDGGATWVQQGDLKIGELATGTPAQHGELSILDGLVVSGESTRIDNGTVQVSGSDSYWSVFHQLTMDDGMLTIDSNGEVFVTSDPGRGSILSIWGQGNGNPELNVLSGGVLDVETNPGRDNPAYLGTNATVLVDGAGSTVKAPWYIMFGSTTEVTVSNNGKLEDTNAANPTEFTEGTLTVNAGGKLEAAGRVDVTMGAQVTIDEASATSAGGKIEDGGTLVKLDDNSTWTSSDKITIEAGATLEASNGSVVYATELENNGIVRGGSGIIDVGLGLWNFGDIIIGFSPGELEVRGALNQQSSGLIEIELAGTTPVSEYDVLNVTGADATLAGTLDLSLLGGFTPAEGQSFIVIDTETTINGTFDDVILPSLSQGLVWQIEYTDDVTLHVVANGSAPIANDDSYYTQTDQVITIDGSYGLLANDFDPDDVPPNPPTVLSVDSYTAPQHGSVTVNNNGGFTYTPQTGFSGTDWFTYVATDGDLLSNTAAVTIDVQAVSPPSLSIADASASEYDGSISFNVTLSEASTNLVKVDYVTSDGSAQAPADYTSASGTIELQPGQTSATVSVTINNDSLDENSEGIAVTLSNPVNATITDDTAAGTIEDDDSSPVTVDDLYVSVLHDTTLQGASVLGNDYDDDGDPLTAVLESDVSNGTVNLSPDGTYTYTPEVGYVGSDSFSYKAFDGTNYSNVATVSIDVTNSDPQAYDDFYYVPHGQSVAGDVLAGDYDADTVDMGRLTAELVSGPTHGQLLSFDNGTFTYLAPAIFVGEDTFTYKLSDGAAEDTATVTITVTNNAPSAEDDYFEAPAPLYEVSGSVLGNDSDPDGDAISAILTSAPLYGTLTDGQGNSLASGDGFDGSFTYTAGAGFTGWDDFGYVVTDGMDTSDEAYVGISEYWEYLTLDQPAATEAADVTPLDLRDVKPLAGEAVERWVLAGVDAGTAKRLAKTIEFHVTDLPGSRLGASGAAGHILLDVNAAGYGWFMDSSPSNDREFQKIIGGSELQATSDSAAAGKVDLLTVVMHEFGHQLGLTD